MGSSSPIRLTTSASGYSRNTAARDRPVGSVYINVDGADPASSLGYGTWESFGEGKTLIGVDSGDPDFEDPDLTGGSKTHSMTVAEMPSHTHDVYIGNTGSGNPSLASGGLLTGGASNDRVLSAGGGAPFPILPPYITVYFWKRTA